MGIDFDNIKNHIIPINKFELNWRFTDENYHQLPQEHLIQLKPLDTQASGFLSSYILSKQLHQDFPFKKGFFSNIDQVEISDSDVIRKWLFDLDIPISQEVILSWNLSTSMIVPWKILIQYYDDFYYPDSDDLTIFDQTLNWAVLFHHQDEIFYGNNI